MSHKYVKASLIKDIEEEIRSCAVSVDRIRSIGRGGEGGMRELVEQIKILRESAMDKKNMAMDLMMTNGAGNVLDVRLQEKSALLCRGQEKAFDIILQLMENPDEAIRFYTDRKSELEADLLNYRKYEERV